MRSLPWALVACSLLVTHATRAQHSATLDRYGPSEAPGDGFVLSGTHVPKHLGFTAQLHLEYANDPLVYETTAGQQGSELVALVSDQARAHLGVGLGLLDILLVYVALPVDLALAGTPVGDQPTATGFGLGDLALGVRGTLLDRPGGSIAVQARLSLPSGSNGEGERPGVAGESGVSGQPEFLGEMVFGPVHLLANLGMLFRDDFAVPSAKFSDELTYGVGGFVVLPPAEQVQMHLELFGATPLDDVGQSVGTALELLVGLKVRLATGLYAGASGGFGLTRGYGSPDYRIASLLVWEQSPRKPPRSAEPEPEPVPAPEPAPVPERPSAVIATGPSDSDRDGLLDDRDACPDEAGLAEHEGCPHHLRFEPETGTLVLLDPIEFEPERAELRATTLSVVDELALAIGSDPARLVRLEAHATRRRGRDEMALSRARALALAEALMERGIARAQLEAIGCGANRPVHSGLSRRRGSNERVEVRVLRPLPPPGMPSSLGCEEVALPDPEPVPAPVPVPEPEPEPVPVSVSAAPVIAAPVASAPPVAAPPVAAAPVAAAPAAPALLAATGTGAALLAALAAAPAADQDSDKLANSDDRCPLAPGAAKAAGCPASHDVDLTAGRIALTDPLHFAKGGTRVRSHSASIMPEVAATLRANPSFKVLILVHTGSDGSAEAALELSRERAATVRQHLIAEHIDGQRLQALGCGQGQPIAPTNVPWGDKKNERVELWLLDPAGASGLPSVEGCKSSD